VSGRDNADGPARDGPAAEGRLRDYHAKRDFQRTAEPRGGTVESSGSGRLFVVQKHAARQLHYDLRLEFDGVLKSWAVPKGPCLDPRQKPLAVLVEDHPIEYGDFEGIIPAGEYGGGTVMLWDRGQWEPLADARSGLEKGDLKFRLLGEKLRGAWVLARMGGEAGRSGRNWLLIKKADDEARPLSVFNVLAERPFSVQSGRSMDQIAADPRAVWVEGRAQPTGSSGGAAAAPAAQAAPPAELADLEGARPADVPAVLAPQLAESADRPPGGADWIHEPKLDGYRMLCRLEEGGARLLTRNGHDWTDRMPLVAQAAGRLPLGAAWIDGEVVALGPDGLPDFGALQNAFQHQAPASLTYFVFDLPFAWGHDLTRVSLVERKRLLRAALDAGQAAPTIQFCEHFAGDGATVLAQARRMGLEGIISKRARAHYSTRRSDTWLKIKCRLRQEFVVGGFTNPEGSRSGFGALLVGYHDDEGRLRYCGRVGTGFSQRLLADLGRDLRERCTDAAPFRNPQDDPDWRRVSWVRPDRVVEVEFTAWTHEGLLRHAAFLGLRPDKPASSVVLERPMRPSAVRGKRAAQPPTRAAAVVVAPGAPEDALVGGVRISHPSRTVYPEQRLTKRDLAEYYLAVAERILPFVARRPLSLVRCPLGLEGEIFYQRQAGEGFPASIKPSPPADSEESEPYLLIDDRDGLLSLVQMGVMEIHVWGCRADNLERPDLLVFDLDPGEGITWPDVAASGIFVRDFLGDLGLRSFVKTTGGKGLHLVVPVVRRAGWDEVKAFSHAVARALSRRAPRNFVATIAKAQRANRIFIDYLRNQRGSTAVAPYSTRARPGACVSTPLSWEEVAEALPPDRFTVSTVPQRLAQPDPWADFQATRQSVTASMRKALGLE
jgi:bifunctional non-homologous end joining protein LigD